MSKFRDYHWRVQWIEGDRILVRPFRRECDARRLEKALVFLAKQREENIELQSIEVRPL